MCYTPFNVTTKMGEQKQVPCGKCPKCIARRISAWSFRLMQQLRVSENAHFILLTYDTNNVPITGHGYMSLDKKHVQDFFKRLRKAHTGSRGGIIKYFAVGEYGGQRTRPHYHVIMFNVDIGKIQAAWTHGQVYYGDERGVTPASVGYCLKYMQKPGKIPMHQNDDRQKEFQLMSKGLGENYLIATAKRWHKADILNRMHLTIEDGKKIAMPRYYKDKLYSKSQRQKLAYEFQMRFEEDPQNEKNYKDPMYEHNQFFGKLAETKHMHLTAVSGRDLQEL